jgi:hypothetical protein
MPKKQRYGGLSSRHDLHHHRSCYRFFEARAAANLRDPLDPIQRASRQQFSLRLAAF